MAEYVATKLITLYPIPLVHICRQLVHLVAMAQDIEKKIAILFKVISCILAEFTGN